MNHVLSQTLCDILFYFILVLGMIFVNFLRVGKLPLWRKILEWMVQEMYQFDVNGSKKINFDDLEIFVKVEITKGNKH